MSSSLYEDVYLHSDGGPQSDPELWQDVHTELVFVLVWPESLHLAHQPGVAVVEVGPGEKHGSSALALTHVEHPGRSTALLSRGTVARTVSWTEDCCAGGEPEGLQTMVTDCLLTSHSWSTLHYTLTVLTLYCSPRERHIALL